MNKIAETLDGCYIYPEDVRRLGAVYDEEEDLFWFSDGSAGRLVRIKMGFGCDYNSEYLFRFIWLRMINDAGYERLTSSAQGSHPPV